MSAVAEVMSRRLVSVLPETPVVDADRLAIDRRVRHLLVTRPGNLVGVVCVCDLRNRDPFAPVSACMHTPVVTVRPEASLEEAAQLMRANSVGCLPVMSGRLLLGVITRRDLHRAGFAYDEALGARFCAACGAHHDVVPDECAAFCAECLERAHDRNDEELGAGD